MALCEACSLKLVKMMIVPLNALFKIPGMILRNKMSALVTMSSVWNSDGDKECIGNSFCCGFNICREMCDLGLYFEYLGSTRVLYPRGHNS